MVKSVPERLLSFSKILRNKPTIWELKLWSHLKGKNLGVRFKRQVRIGPYIVDFSCFSKKLIIEIDGSYHKTLVGKKNDQEKIAFLEQGGYKIIRFWNSEIDKNLNKVLEKIISELTPPPTPPLVRGGEF